ncbi:MAG: flap endonuclease-1 [Candidatus Nanohaloarchaeota archaeon QJJ-5]|nr:flap endonuclease-1 [Candidatus Nanohaloarchaeota archaeon QJJ-5]
MGTALGELIETEEISFEHMNDQTIAVDAMNTLYQFLSIIRQPTGSPLKDSQGRVTSHLSGLFYRTNKLLQKNIEPVYVFDGSSPELKQKEQQKRKEKREKARKEWKEAVQAGDMDEAFTKATQSSKLTSDDIKRAKQLLDAMGVPYIQAPSEGEAQAAFMNTNNHVWAVGSQDWDSLLFGADRLVKNLTTTGRRKIQGKDAYKQVVPELVTREQALDQIDVSHEELIWIGLLLGTDFNPGGIKGIGPKTAPELVRQYESFGQLLQEEGLDWEHDSNHETIIDFFKDPPTVDVAFSSDEPDIEAIVELLVEAHDFSEDRVRSTAQDMQEARQSRQKGLGSFT